MSSRKTRKRFSSFSLIETIEWLGIKELKEWDLTRIAPVAPSQLYEETMQRLKNGFDLSFTEAARVMVIDTIFTEVISNYPALKIWKEAPLQTEFLTGKAEYLLAPAGLVYKNPLLCITEAKKDDFEQGTAQCLLEVDACYRLNIEKNHRNPVFGIVTNASAWRFFEYLGAANVLQSDLIGETNRELIFGILHNIFGRCQQYAQKSE